MSIINHDDDAVHDHRRGGHDGDDDLNDRDVDDYRKDDHVIYDLVRDENDQNDYFISIDVLFPVIFHPDDHDDLDVGDHDCQDHDDGHDNNRDAHDGNGNLDSHDVDDDCNHEDHVFSCDDDHARVVLVESDDLDDDHDDHDVYDRDHHDYYVDHDLHYDYFDYRDDDYSDGCPYDLIYVHDDHGLDRS